MEVYGIFLSPPLLLLLSGRENLTTKGALGGSRSRGGRGRRTGEGSEGGGEMGKKGEYRDEGGSSSGYGR